MAEGKQNLNHHQIIQQNLQQRAQKRLQNCINTFAGSLKGQKSENCQNLAE
jgi:hypothetical protein